MVDASFHYPLCESSHIDLLERLRLLRRPKRARYGHCATCSGKIGYRLTADPPMSVRLVSLVFGFGPLTIAMFPDLAPNWWMPLTLLGLTALYLLLPPGRPPRN